MTILSASSVRTLAFIEMKHSRPPDLKSSSNVSLPFAWITGPATDPSYHPSNKPNNSVKISRYWFFIHIIIICLNCCSFADISSSTSSQKFLEFQSIKMKLVSKDHNPLCHIFAFNRRWKCEDSFPNSLWSISYLGVIWEFYILALKTQVFFVKKAFSQDKWLTVPK